jgi:hypothetical protein
MATYLQGVQDYIPQFQPFQPDLNLYANVLQTKQTQYDTAWKSLNNIYGQYFYADLTHGDNIARKDELMKNIDFNLQRVAGLDLSLEQNIDQAVQVFKPFYEDQYLMKDMAYTKNYINQMNRADSYKNSDNEKMRGMYWNDGVAAMNYQRDEFRKSDISETLNFQNIEYTPYVNVNKRALEIAKEADLNIESVDFSPDGRWVVTKKNGEQVLEPLSKLFEAQLGSDPAIQDVYRTQAYVNRKNYSYSNAAQFGNDENQAEMQYLQESYDMLKEQSQQRYKQLQDQSTYYSSMIADIEKQVANGTASPRAKQALAQYKSAKETNDKVLARADENNNNLNGDDQNATANTSGKINPYGDLKSLRWKVDNGMASLLMQKDLDEAAEIYAYRNAKTSIEANPYAVNEQKFAHDRAIAQIRGNYMLEATRLRNKGEKETNMDKQLVEAGTHRYDLEKTLPDGSPNPNYGRAIEIDAYTRVTTEKKDDGSASGNYNARSMDRQISEMETKEHALPYLQDMAKMVTTLVAANQMTKQQAKQILGMDYNTFQSKLNNNPNWFIRRELGATKLTSIKNNMDNWLGKNYEASALKLYATDLANLKHGSTKFGDYIAYVNESQEWRQKTAKEAEQQLYKQGYKYAKYMYDPQGNLRSEKEFYAMLPEEAKQEYGYKVKGATGAGGISGVGQNPLGQVSGDMSRKAGDRYETEINYQSMKNSLAKIYTSGQIQAPVIGMEKFGTMTGAGKFAYEVSTAWITPKGINTPNMARFGEVLNDLGRFDWGSTNNNRVSLRGTSKSDYDYYADNNRNDIGKALLDNIISEIHSNKSKMGDFKLQVAPMAAGSVEKAAIIITPDSEWLKQFVYQKNTDGTKKGSGMISPEQYDMIMRNGISYIMPADQMSNSMYTSAFQSPLETIIQNNPGGYTYTDPQNPAYSINIQKSNSVAGPYMYSTTFGYIDPETGEQKTAPPVVDFTNDPDALRDNMLNYFDLNQRGLIGF